jgi:hypothetical protein
MLVSTPEDLTAAQRGQRGLLGYGHASLANTWGYGASLARAYPQTYPHDHLAGKEVRSTINRLRSAVEVLEWRNRTGIRVRDSNWRPTVQELT